MPLRYEVVLAPGAFKEIKKLQGSTRSAVLASLDLLAEQPRSGKPLVGELAGCWSLRRGDYRIIYRINDATKRVDVARISHRREVYKRR